MEWPSTADHGVMPVVPVVPVVPGAGEAPRHAGPNGPYRAQPLDTVPARRVTLSYPFASDDVQRTRTGSPLTSYLTIETSQDAGDGIQWQQLAFGVIFALYLAGLLLWLGIGLVPSATSAIPAFKRWLLDVAASHGAWHGLAARILATNLTNSRGRDVAVQYLFSLLNLALGVLLALRRPRQLVPRLLAFALLGTAATFNKPSHAVFHVIGHNPVVTTIHFVFHVVSGVAYLWAVVLFPDGRLPPGIRASRSTRRWLAVATTVAVTIVCWRSSFIAHPEFFVVFFGVLIPLSGMAAQSSRLRSPAGPEEHQQARLLRGALIPAFVTGLAWLAARALVTIGGSPGDAAAGVDRWLQGAFPAVFAVVPIMLFVAVLRYRLWDIDVVVSRTLMYGSLVGLILMIDVLVVAGTVWLLGTGLWLTVIVVATVGLLVEPARETVRALANRVVFGQALSPTEAMRSLADGLEKLGPNDELIELTRVVVLGTRAAAAQLWLVIDDSLMSVAKWPFDHQSRTEPDWRPLNTGDTDLDALAAVVDADWCVPIYHQSRLLGVLGISIHRGVVLPPAERRLVMDLAGHAGLLVHNAQLTVELAHHVERLEAQAVELRESRERLVAAHDAERRNLERNIHDGAQQELVALLIGLKTIVNLSPGSDEARQEITEVRAMLADTAATLEQLCGGSLPGILVDGGLAEALNAVVPAMRRVGIEVVIVTELPRRAHLDVEAAAYFCCREALQNAAKHARATHIWVRASMPGDELQFEVDDDGIGFDPATEVRRSGLSNMVERLSLLGGSVAIMSEVNRGTSIRGRIPCLIAESAGVEP
jgi:signal transduction histidine kinase